MAWSSINRGGGSKRSGNKGRDNEPPCLPCLRESVKEDDRSFSAAGSDVVKPKFRRQLGRFVYEHFITPTSTLTIPPPALPPHSRASHSSTGRPCAPPPSAPAPLHPRFPGSFRATPPRSETRRRRPGPA